MTQATKVLRCPDCDGDGSVCDRHPHDPDAVDSECESCCGVGSWACCPRCEDYVGGNAELAAHSIDAVRAEFARRPSDKAIAAYLTDYDRVESTGQCAACDRADQAEEDERAKLDSISMAAELTVSSHSCNCVICGRGIWSDAPRVEFGAAALCIPCAEGASAALTLAAVKGVAA